MHRPGLTGRKENRVVKCKVTDVLLCTRLAGSKQMGFLLYEKIGRVPCFLIPEFGKRGALAVFTTRRGGVSREPYESLNLGLHTGDHPRAVVANRNILFAALGMRQDRVFTLNQVHGDRVVVIQDEDDLRRKRGADADAVITHLNNVVLTCFFADCQGIYIFDPAHRVIALAHAGWRGTVARIAEKCLQVMVRVYGSRPGDCLAAISPAAGVCCYEVGDDVCLAVREAFPGEWKNLLVRKENGRLYFGMSLANFRVLQEAGVKRENIIDSGLCTICRQDLFFSYRGSGGTTGRMAALLSLTQRRDKSGLSLLW